MHLCEALAFSAPRDLASAARASREWRSAGSPAWAKLHRAAIQIQRAWLCTTARLRAIRLRRDIVADLDGDRIPAWRRRRPWDPTLLAAHHACAHGELFGIPWAVSKLQLHGMPAPEQAARPGLTGAFAFYRRLSMEQLLRLGL